MQWGYWTNGWRLVPLSLDLSWFSPFLRTLAPFRGIVGVFGSVFVCVCLLGWVFLLDVLGWMFIPFLFGHCWIFGSSNRESKSKVKSPVHSYECNHLYEWMGCVVWFHTPAVDPTERLWGWTSSSFGELVERIPWFSDWFQLSPPTLWPCWCRRRICWNGDLSEEYAHTHTHFRAAWCSQLNDSTVLKSRIEHVRLGLVVLLLLFAVSWLPADLLVKGRMLTICSLHADSVRIETMEWMALHLIHDKHKSITFKRNAQGNFIAFGVHFFTLGERWIKHNSNVSSSIWLYSVGTKQTQYWRNEKQT